MRSTCTHLVVVVHRLHHTVAHPPHRVPEFCVSTQAGVQRDLGLAGLWGVQYGLQYEIEAERAAVALLGGRQHLRLRDRGDRDWLLTGDLKRWHASYARGVTGALLGGRQHLCLRARNSGNRHCIRSVKGEICCVDKLVRSRRCSVGDSTYAELESIRCSCHERTDLLCRVESQRRQQVLHRVGRLSLH